MSGPLTLERVVAGLGVYPLPQTAIIPTLMRMTADLNTNVGDLARVLSCDPALVAKVLHLSNSPFYGCRQTITSLPEAIQVLGFYSIRTLAVAASAYTLFRRQEDIEFEQSLWRHSLAVAIASRLIARRVGSRQVEEEMFLTGLLHDIAKLVLLQEYPDFYKPIMRDALESGSGPLIEESARLGFTHAHLGAIILDQWGFPPRIIGVIHHYDVPDLPYFIRERNGVTEGDFTLPHMLCLAHEMANNLGHGFMEHTETDLSLLPSSGYLGLDQKALAELCGQVVMLYFEELGFYSQSMTSTAPDRVTSQA